MANYDTEQGGERNSADHGESERLDRDLKPWLREEWGLDVFIDEFPYFQYAGQDFDPEDDEGVKQFLSREYNPDTIQEVRNEYRGSYFDHTFQKGPFRTDVVGVQVDRQALRTRIRRVGTTESMNGSQQAKRRRRRTFLTFVGDGPMTREYWEGDHGGADELRSYGSSSASRGFGWLKKRGFLAPVGGGNWDAVDIPLHIYGRTHAFELKLTPGEWETALEQAARADVFADHRWVVYDRDTAPTEPDQLETFRDRGVGLLTVHPEDGVAVEVWADRCTREVDRDMLDRYNVERWDVNERVLSELNAAREWEPPEDEDAMFTPVEPDAPDLLADLQPEDVGTEPEAPTVHGFHAGSRDGAHVSDPPGENKPLTAFAGGEDDE